MSPTIRHLAAVVALSLAAISGAAAAKTPACKTVKCVKCQNACYAAYNKKLNGPNFNPETAPIFMRQYRACRAACVK